MEEVTDAPLIGTALILWDSWEPLGFGCAFIIFIIIYHGTHKYLARETAPEYQ
jgi:hypothetical protein